MIKSTKFKFAALLVGSLTILAVGAGSLTAYSVNETLTGQLLESSRNAVHLSSNNVRDRYQELFSLKVEQALQIKSILSLYERIIRSTETANSQHTIDTLRKLALPNGIFLWIVDDNMDQIAENGDRPAGFIPQRRNDIKGREVGSNMLRFARNGVNANALVQFTDPDGSIHKYFGHHFYLARHNLLIGIWADVGPLEARQEIYLKQAVESLQTRFENINIGVSGFLFVTDASGNIIISPEGWDLANILKGVRSKAGDALMDDIKISALDPALPLAAVFPTSKGDREVLIHSDFIRPLQWYISGVSFVDEMRAPGQKLSTHLAAIILSGAAFLVLFSLFLVGKLTQPLVKLASFARQIPLIDFFADQDDEQLALRRLSTSRSGEEIRELAGAFLFMDQALRSRVRELVDATSSRERMTGELEAAKEIQMGFLPSKMSDGVADGRFVLSGFLTPAREVGGDLFDYCMLDENRVCVVIGDVSDKGVPAALFMSMTMVLIRSSYRLAGGPDDILCAVNDNLSRENPNSMFVTMFIGILDLRTGSLQYANAGHNPPLVKSPSGIRRLEDLHGPVVAAFDQIAYSQSSTTLNAGDFLVLYTDGIPEAMNAVDDQFGEENFKEIIEKSTADSPEKLLHEVKAAVDTHVAGAPASDDVTMLCIQLLTRP